MKQLNIILPLLFFFSIAASPTPDNKTPKYGQSIDSIIALLPDLAGQEKLDAYTALDAELNSLNNIHIHLRFLNEYIAEARQQKNTDEEGFALLQKISLYDNYGISDSIWHYAPGVLEFLEKEEEWNYYYYLTALLTTDLIQHDRIEEAFEYTRNCYKEAKQKGLLKGVGVALSNTGRIYQHIENIAEAEKQYREAIDILSKTSEEIVLYETYSYLAEILSFSKRYEEKMAIIKQWESALAKNYTPPQPGIPATASAQWFNLYLEYATAHAQLEEFDQAKHYLRLAKETPYVHIDVGRAQVNLCQLYLHEQLGEYDQALLLADSVYNMYLELSNSPYLQILETKIRIARLKGDFELAVNVYDTVTALRDSLQRKDINAQLDELRTQYEVDRHVMEKIRNRNYAWLLTIALLLVVSVLVIWIVYSRRLHTKNVRLVKQINELDRLTAEAKECKESKEGKDDKDDKASKNGRIKRKSEAAADASTTAQTSELMLRLKTLMKEEQLYTNLDMNRKILATRLNTNESYLRNAIKDELGLTFSEYICELRLNHAKELLKLPGEQHTIENIATDSGFGSRSTMYRQFRNKFGLSPDEFRKISMEL